MTITLCLVFEAFTSVVCFFLAFIALGGILY